MENIEIETNAETMDNSVIFHVIKDVMGFILYMHQQIPSVFQDIGLEFDALKDEYHELEMDLAQAESNASVRRKHMGKIREAIRALIAKGVGSDSYPGSTKLFLLVKAPSSFTLPPHFLPKRGFRYSKKITPVRLQLKCKSQNLKMDIPDSACQTSSSINLGDSTSNEFIW
ncbi:hypothetical protein GH714_037056 [Hevea brasiliensis]|uniref:Uncharacterized protein n=1 Tax=Hevea brasiliensis TaxID=3981 RepID=A0A6A6MQN3_HEVBR|nr:hypothetical protein GH714_037056 [Hevea brasiliensis]